jgi:hypothetical protein
LVVIVEVGCLSTHPHDYHNFNKANLFYYQKKEANNGDRVSPYCKLHVSASPPSIRTKSLGIGQQKMQGQIAEGVLESQNQLPQSEDQGKGTTFLKTCFNGINALSGIYLSLGTSMLWIP